jgi:hypothetical protein
MCLVNISISLHTKFAAVAHVAERQFLHATKNGEVFNIMNNTNKNGKLQYCYSDQIM